MELEISRAVREKLLNRHKVTESEIEECFENRDGEFLVDSREEHKTDPLTQWFIAETDKRRKLKVVFIFYSDSGKVVIKTCYSPSPTVVELYEKYK